MKKDNFKRKCLIYLCGISITIGVFGVSHPQADGIPKTTKQKIEDAKKIWEIENLYKKTDEKSMLKLSLFLEDENRGIRRIASRKLVLLNDKKAVRYLKEAKKDDMKGMSKIADILIKLKNKKEEEICEEILALKKNEIEIYENKVKILDLAKKKEEKEKIFSFLRKHRIESSGDEFVYIFCERGWVDRLPVDMKKYPKLTRIVKYHHEVAYIRIKERINKLPVKKRKKELVNLLTNWRSVFEYEAAIRLLAEIGNEIIPDILKMFDDPANMPPKIPPPFEKSHTTYHILLTVLKTTPDNRSLKKLNELASSNNEFISKKARETLEWIKSGVPYPFKYERVLLASPDEY